MTTTASGAHPYAKPGGPRQPILAVRNLTITFPATRGGRDGGLRVLDALSLEVHDGEFVAVLGPSGCGKSTLLRALGGLLDPRAEVSGEVTVAGEDSAAKNAAARGATAWMPQRDGLLPWRRAMANAMVGAIAAGVPRDRAYPRAQRLFEDFGLAGFERAWPHELSGGMRQRLALLRTCLADRPILLLDEPFGGLDPVTRRRMNAWLASMRLTERAAAADARAGGAAVAGSAVVLVTHDIDEAIALSDRIVVLSGRPGRIVHDVRAQRGRDSPYDRTALLAALDC